MPNLAFRTIDIVRLTNEFGHQATDEAVRQSLINSRIIGPNDSLAQAFMKPMIQAQPFDFAPIHDYLEMLKKVGRPLPTAPERPGGVKIQGGRLGILGNPIYLDSGLSSGWHFDQTNGYDAWFNIVPILSGGYWVLSPVMRKTGSHGAGTSGDETTANATSDNSIEFEVNWQGGGRGHYVCQLFQQLQGPRLNGFTYDVNNPDIVAGFVGTPMSLTKQAPGNWPPVAPGAGPLSHQPILTMEMTQNTSDNGYNVTLHGSGFVDGESIVIEGRFAMNSLNYDWTFFADASADFLGSFTVEFGVVQPLGGHYTFRAVGNQSGYSPEVGS